MKYRIADSQDETDYLILNYDDPVLRQARFWGKPQILHFSTKQRVEDGVCVKDGNLVYASGGRSRTICPTSKLGIKGPHNLANAAAAAAMVLPLGIDIEAVARGLETFRPIEHRLEPVMDIKGVSFINDSKATNVDSVFYALQSEDRPLIVIMGGRDKAGDFPRLAAFGKTACQTDSPDRRSHRQDRSQSRQRHRNYQSQRYLRSRRNRLPRVIRR